MYIIVSGNPVDGLSFTGPFNSSEDAVEWGDSVRTDWWVTSIEKPDDDAQTPAEMRAQIFDDNNEIVSLRAQVAELQGLIRRVKELDVRMNSGNDPRTPTGDDYKDALILLGISS